MLRFYLLGEEKTGTDEPKDDELCIESFRYSYQLKAGPVVK